MYIPKFESWFSKIVLKQNTLTSKKKQLTLTTMDYKALYEQQLAENKELKAQNEYLWAPVNADDYIRLQKQYDELKAKYEERTLSNRDAWANNRGLKDIIKNKERQIADLKEENKKLTKLKNRALTHITKINKKTKELQKEIEELEVRLEDTLTTSILKGLQIPEDEEEEEVETCCECNTKRECLSDMFVTIRELDGTESVMCGMCSLNHFKSKALQ